MKKFGKAAQNDPAQEKLLVTTSPDEILIEVSKKTANVTVKDEAEDKFHEESLAIAASMNTTTKSWTEVNRSKQIGRDEAGAERPAEPDKPSDLTPAAGEKDVPRAYVPPSLRGKEQTADGKGKGKGNYDGQENSLRVFNLSEDAKEGDLQDLFGTVGRIFRTYLAKDENGMSSAFAFITYYTREDAQKAIDKLNGRGYDNLILHVDVAKPRQ